MRFLFEMSNRERNTWVALAMTLLVSGIYFSEILAVAGERLARRPEPACLAAWPWAQPAALTGGRTG